MSICGDLLGPAMIMELEASWGEDGKIKGLEIGRLDGLLTACGK